MKFDWLNIAKRLEAIAQTGFTYSKDDYDRERYQEIRDIGHTIFNHYTGAPVEKIQNLFSGENGYPTPKVDIRGVIFEKDQIMLVKEKTDGLWALPGGWAASAAAKPDSRITEPILRPRTSTSISVNGALALMNDLHCSAKPSTESCSRREGFL